MTTPTTNAAPSGTVGADVRCSASGCNRPATWRRQSWVRNMRDQPVCDDHVGFYRACGLACTPIRTPNSAIYRNEVQYTMHPKMARKLTDYRRRQTRRATA